MEVESVHTLDTGIEEAGPNPYSSTKYSHLVPAPRMQSQLICGFWFHETTSSRPNTPNSRDIERRVSLILPANPSCSINTSTKPREPRARDLWLGLGEAEAQAEVWRGTAWRWCSRSVMVGDCSGRLPCPVGSLTVVCLYFYGVVGSVWDVAWRWPAGVVVWSSSTGRQG
jgi:hypothetical protein